MKTVPGGRQEGSIEIDNHRLAYISEGSGHALLVIGSAIYYDRVFARTELGDYRRVFVDMRHFSDSVGNRRAGEITLQDYMADIDAIVHHLDLKRFSLLGHSHHGNLAIEYAIHDPARVLDVVLMGTPPAGIDEIEVAARDYWKSNASEERKRALSRRRADAHERIADGHGSFLVRNYIEDAPLYWYDFTYDAGELWEGLPLDRIALQAFKGFFRQYDAAARLRELHQPVLVVMGEQDFTVPPTLWDELPLSNLGVRYRCVPKCGHTPPLEKPSEFSAIVREWHADVLSGPDRDS